jgi:hypothetical protein
MSKGDFEARLRALGFSSTDGKFFRRHRGRETQMVIVHESTAWASYDWGGDTGSIEMTDDPVGDPFDVVLVAIERGY